MRPQPHLIPPVATVHKGEMVIPRVYGCHQFAIGGMVSYDLPSRPRTPRCSYCATLVTTAVRCPSCGAPR
jgi:hypothetical protein